MYNHELKSIFTHIPKTAGWSVHTCLQKRCGFHHGGHQSNFRNRNPHISTLHYPCKMLKDEYLDNYFKFCFVRNPWDLMVSSYNWWIRDPKGQPRKRKIQNIIMQMSFGDFIKSEYSNQVNEVKHLGVGQHHWFTDDDGNILVDFIGRFENLQEDFNVVCDKIGIPKQELPHKNKTKHKHYTEYYDDGTREIVAEKYAKDIEYFGYKFGE